MKKLPTDTIASPALLEAVDALRAAGERRRRNRANPVATGHFREETNAPGTGGNLPGRDGIAAVGLGQSHRGSADAVASGQDDDVFE